MEGERKQVTVLFADMKGSMELLADRDPEEARKLFDAVIEQMMEAVHRYEGTVNHILGDGIMALFGAPLAHEDHAVRACYAALRMQESVKRYASEIQRTQGIPIQIRVGLNSGEVVVGAIRNDLHMDYTAVGQITHLAARMEQIAMPGSIMMTADALRLCEGYVQVKPLGPVDVKGLREAVEVYEITGAGTVRSRLQAAAARGLTRFVGRDPELEQLRQALERAGTGHGQVVAVVGDPGVGKSRLFWEFTHSHRTQGWLILESSSVSYGKATAFLPLIDLLRAYFQIEARDEARKIREKVTGKLLSLDRALESSLPALLWLLDVSVDDPQWQRLDPPQRRQQTLDGIKRLLLRESQVQPLLLVFEDLHWIDAETQAFLERVVESLPSTHVLLLVNYRPEYQHVWGGKTYYRQLRIDPLSAESAEALLEVLLGNDAGLQPLKRLLIERTEGNPFFLEESVRTLVETKVLAGERSAYRLTTASQTLQIPATTQAILAARIDRLAPEDKRLLQAASVLGKDVPFALLQAIVEEPEETLRRGLATLQAAEFLYEARLFPDLQYTFKHALTHDVAYGGLLQERRRQFHTRIVQAIEHRYPDRLQEYVEQLSHHAFKGEVWDKAAAYLRQAGAKAAARSANREAVGYFEQALAALQHLPETRETFEQAIDLRFELRPSLFALGDLQRLTEHLREAEALAQALGDQLRLGRVSLHKSHYLWSTGHAAEARASAENAQVIAEALGDLPLQVGATHYLGAVCLTSGNYRQAETFLQKVVHLLGGDRSRDRCGLTGFPAAMARGWLAWALAERGAFDEGIVYGQDGLRLAEALDHPYSWIAASWGPAHLYRLRGEISHAVRLLERALSLCRDWDILILSGTTAGLLGFVYVLSGRVAEGLSLLSEAQESEKQYQTLIITHMGEACLLTGRVDKAIAFADRALTFAQERGQQGYEAYALRLLGEIAAREDPLDIGKAEDHYRQALALAEELGMRPLIAHCHVSLGKLHRRTGKQQQAKEYLTTGVSMMREMQMGLWLEKAEAELKELG
jgi:class 3 adenylate cyclase/tetratricopeptide (TPR) repeat protein